MASAAGLWAPIRLSRVARLESINRVLNAIAVLTVLWLSSSRIVAQTNAATPATSSPNRFLFIVETSRAMRPRASGVFDAMKQALDSSLNGQIHQGDLVGIWTFNENVYQKVFPSQAWSQPTQLAFAVRLPSLAEPDTYLKRAHLEKVIPEMLKAISESENVTIIFVSSGEGEMRGTPFSAQINSAWKEWHDEQEGVHMPLITALRTRNGQPVDWLLTPAPRPINLPALGTDDEKESNPRGVILESGTVTKNPAATTLAPEQQVAFSVWALGTTGLVTSAVSAAKTSAQIQDSVPPAALLGTNSIETSSQKLPENNSSNLVAAVPSSKVQAIPAPEPSHSVKPQKNPISKEAPVSAQLSNDPPVEVAKPVELVFVTNVPAQFVATREPEANVKRSVDTPPQVDVLSASSPPKDIVGQQLLAHARAADPEQEKRASEPALPPVKRSFLRENINPLVLMTVAAFGAAYSFRMWFFTNARVGGRSVSFTRSGEGESSDDMPDTEGETNGAETTERAPAAKATRAERRERVVKGMR